MFENKWMKLFGVSLLIFILLLFFMTIPLIKGQHIFSNIFVDSYMPRKVLIVEKAPVRIIFFGETGDNFDSNTTTEIIRALDKVQYIPGYHLNKETIISVDSELTGDRKRGSSKSVIGTDTHSDEYKNYRQREPREPRTREY